jgi:hypothetical protein
MSTNLGWLSHIFDRSGRTLGAPMVRGMGNLIIYDDCLVFARLTYRDAFLASVSGNRLNDRVDLLANDQAALSPDELIARSPRHWIVRYDDVASVRYHAGTEERTDAEGGATVMKVPMESFSIELLGGSTKQLWRGTSLRGPGRSLLGQALQERLIIV